MKKKILGLLLGLALTGVILNGCGKDEEKTAEAPATTQEPVSEAQLTEQEASDDSVQPEAEPESAQTVEEAAETVKAGEDISYVDGFYANKGDTDFMILFYENAPGDVAYVYDGENEAFDRTGSRRTLRCCGSGIKSSNPVTSISKNL